MSFVVVLRSSGTSFFLVISAWHVGEDISLRPAYSLRTVVPDSGDEEEACNSLFIEVPIKLLMFEKFHGTNGAFEIREDLKSPIQ